MSTTRELIASEVARHVDLIRYDDERRDTGGLRCSCGQWAALPSPGEGRPRGLFNLHVADAIQARITRPEHIDALTAIRERLGARRIGTSYMREMDRDIISLRSAEKSLAVLLAHHFEEPTRGE